MKHNHKRCFNFLEKLSQLLLHPITMCEGETLTQVKKYIYKYLSYHSSLNSILFFAKRKEKWLHFWSIAKLLSTKVIIY